MCQCGGGREEGEDIIHGSLLVISPVEDGNGPVKWIQTLFISQNYVSPLWYCAKSKWKSLICCIDSKSFVTPFHTYGACLSLTQRYATLGSCHMASRVAYSNFPQNMKVTITNELVEGKMHHLLTKETMEYISFWTKMSDLLCKTHFYKGECFSVFVLWR